jgi:hypothetical protein
VKDIESETNLDFFPLFGELFSNWKNREAENTDTHWGDD